MSSIQDQPLNMHQFVVFIPVCLYFLFYFVISPRFVASPLVCPASTGFTCSLLTCPRLCVGVCVLPFVFVSSPSFPSVCLFLPQFFFSIGLHVSDWHLALVVFCLINHSTESALPASSAFKSKPLVFLAPGWILFQRPVIFNPQSVLLAMS